MSDRKIVVYIATSADGYIARSDGNVDWLNRPRTAGDYGMGEFLKSIDTVLFGRTTFDFAIKMGARWGRKTKNYVFTHSPPATSPHPQVEFVNEPVKDFARRLRASPGKDIWMMGGAGIIGSFLDAGELDEFMIHVIPVFIGEGIPLIQPRHREVQLRLLSTTKYDDGVVCLHYSVDREVSKKRRKQR